MERMMQRAFNRMHGLVDNHMTDAPKGESKAAGTSATAAATPGPNNAAAASEGCGDDLATTQPQDSASDAIQHILKCWQSKDYFKLMGLPDPVANALGKAEWACTAGDVSKAYRKLSVLVHPDKNPGEEARAAFESLNETHRMLKDPGRLEGVLRDVASKAVLARDKLESRVDGSQARAALLSTKNASARRLRQQEGAAFEDTIRAQMQRRTEEAKRKAQAVNVARGTQLHASEASKGHSQQQHSAAPDSSKPAPCDGSDDDTEAEARARVARQASAKRRRPTILN